jgi:acyl-CoA thioesterase-1
MRSEREGGRPAIPAGRWWLVGAVLAAAGCAGAKDDDPPQAAKPASTVRAESVPPAVTAGPATGGPRVLFVGTSLTAGLGLDPDSAYPALVARTAAAEGVPIRVTNAGLSGETSAGALRRVDWLLREPFDVVVVESGANDGLRGVDPDSTRANLRAVIARVRQALPAARIALVQMEAPTNLGAAYTARFRALYPAVAEAAGIPLLPFLLDGVAGLPQLNQPDGIHPNEAGARRVAANVWRALKPVVEGVEPGATGAGAAAPPR